MTSVVRNMAILNVGMVTLFAQQILLYLVCVIVASRLGRLVLPKDTRATLDVWASCRFWRNVDFVKERWMRVHLTGDLFDPRASALVISNHLSAMDYLVLGSLCHSSQVRGLCSFCTWSRCSRIPGVRSLLRAWRGSPEWTLSESQLSRVAEQQLANSGPAWTVLFPEVVVPDAELLMRQRPILAHAGAHELNHLVYPRFGPFVQLALLLRHCGVSLVYDFTITYWRRNADGELERAVPSMTDLLASQDPLEVVVDVRRYRLKLWNRHKQRKWLEDRWTAKDRLLSRDSKAIWKSVRPASPPDTQAP